LSQRTSFTARNNHSRKWSPFTRCSREASGGEKKGKERDAAVPTLWKQKLRRTSRTLDPRILDPRRRDDVCAEILNSLAEVERCVAEFLDCEEAFKKRAAGEVASAKAGEQQLLAKIRSLRESVETHADDVKAANDQSVAQQVGDIVPEDIEHKISTMVKADAAPLQVMAALIEIMSRLDGFQRLLDASALAKSSRSPTEQMQTTAESIIKDLPRSETSGTQGRRHGNTKAPKMHNSKDQTLPGDGYDGSSSDQGNRKRRKSSKKRSKKSKSRQSKTDSLDSYQEPAERLPLSDLIKLYRSTLPNVTVGKVLDTMFPAAKMAWDIMQRQYPLSWTIERAMLGAAFEERSATVY
jgi:hypothetical protein